MGGETAATLTIASAAISDDDDNFTCDVTNDESTVVSDAARLGVKHMLAHYKLDGDATDSSGNGYHGELVFALVPISPTDANEIEDPTSAVFTTGLCGGALDLDQGGDGGYFRTLTDAIGIALAGGTEITISAFVKSNDDNTNDGYISLHPPHGSDDGGMRYDNNGTDDVQKMGIRTSVGEHSVETSLKSQTKEWQHCVMTWKSGEDIKVYLDGVLDNLTEENSSNENGGVLAEAPDENALATLFIGRGSKDDDEQHESWDGLIDDVKIFNYALNATQIATLTLDCTGEAVCLFPPSKDLNDDCIQNMEEFVEWVEELYEQTSEWTHITATNCNRVPDCISPDFP